ncbi:metalloregulator ArsR/SmtB family transcription factor [Pendulispora brunnea]|uniref:Metalloregulator ArsR/SmtB family transcription factor n=1 Tax=Pendulispora brunnea TaxID=2905690 RepID=A0ABZ2K7A1_9BACT
MPIRCEPPETGRDLVKRWKKTMTFTPDLDERAAVLGVIAQPTRLRLFYLLDRIGEVCVCDLADILGVSQSAVSQHLAKFKAYGLVTVRRDNQTLFYGLADKPEVRALRKTALAGIEAI